MTDTNIFDNFIRNGNFDEDSIDYICNALKSTPSKILTKTFEELKSLTKDIDKYNCNSFFVNRLNNVILFINFLCEKEKFTDEEITINRNRIKKYREILLLSYSKFNNPELLSCANLLDEVILDKKINVDDLIILLKTLVDKREDVNIIKKLLNSNKGVIILNNNILFDYVFDKAIDSIVMNSPHIYYYIALLKIFYSTKINKDKYIRILNSSEITDENNEFANEIYSILYGDKRSLNTKEIFKKYGIIEDLKTLSIPSFEKTIKDEYIVTIDDFDTRLREDAISIKKDGENYIVGIHVTNAALFVEQDSVFDIQAKNNLKCVYLPYKGVRIFSVGTENKLSLDQNKDRCVLTMHVVLDKDANVKDYYLSNNVIRVANNLSYKESDQIINIKNNTILHYNLNDLYQLTKEISTKNPKKRQYWKLKNPEHNFSEDNKSHVIVSELMVLYNYLIAELMCEENIPFIYRTQDNSYIKKLVNRLNIDIDYLTEKTINSIYLPSRYSPIPLYHNGLNLPMYSHSSDGARRYSDLSNQFLIHYFYFKDINYRFDYDTYLDNIEYLNQRNVELSLMKAEYIRALKKD